MTQRFLAFLLFGVLALTALNGFEQQSATSTATSTGDSEEVTAMHGGTPIPPQNAF